MLIPQTLRFSIHHNNLLVRKPWQASMEISALQSIRFYGLWDQPRRVLVWEDITAKCYSWRRLRQEIGLSPRELMTIQPSPQEWVLRGALQLADLPDMTCFPVNPFTHLHADLAEVWGMRWSSEVLSQMRVTYDQMRAKGMNVHVMAHFDFTLSQWINLAFQVHHAETMTNEQMQGLFQMSKHEIVGIIENFNF